MNRIAAALAEMHAAISADCAKRRALFASLVADGVSEDDALHEAYFSHLNRTQYDRLSKAYDLAFAPH